MAPTSLPRLTTQVQLMVHEEFVDHPHYALEQMQRLQNENPLIFAFITNYAMESSSGPVSQIHGMLLVYCLLEAQAAANSASV